jgi:beta-galactosidase
VHSNLPEVELFLNGASLGRQKMPPRSHLAWNVNYAPGTLEARGIRDDKVVVTDKVETTGAAAKIVLTPDRSEINADGEDVSVVKVAVVDAQGRVVPTASNLVKFEIAGNAKIIGVGNGDPSCHEPDKASQRTAFNGLCMTIVQAGRQSGEIKLTATGDGIESGTVILNAKPATPRPAVAVISR